MVKINDPVSQMLRACDIGKTTSKLTYVYIFGASVKKYYKKNLEVKDAI